MGQMFTLKNMCEKYLENGKAPYITFMDLEKAFDRVDRRVLRQVVQMYGVGGKLLEAAKGFCS